MEPAQFIAAILGSSVLGGVLTKVIDWIRDARAGHLSERRAEVDRATQRATEAEKRAADFERRAADSEAAEDAAARRARGRGIPLRPPPHHHRRVLPGTVSTSRLPVPQGLT